MLGHDELLNFLEFILSNFCGRFYKNSHISLLFEILVCNRALVRGQIISICVISYEYLPFHFNKTSMYLHHQRREDSAERLQGPHHLLPLWPPWSLSVTSMKWHRQVNSVRSWWILQNDHFSFCQKYGWEKDTGVIIADNKTNFRINDCGSILM